MTTSHFEGELTGLARHPDKAEFVTAGGDGTVGRSLLFAAVPWYCPDRKRDTCRAIKTLEKSTPVTRVLSSSYIGARWLWSHTVISCVSR